MSLYIEGESLEGLGDRLGRMLIASQLAERFKRGVRWIWPVNHCCAASFETLFELHPSSRIEMVGKHPEGPYKMLWDRTLKISDSDLSSVEFMNARWRVQPGYYGSDFSDFDLNFKPSTRVDGLVKRFQEQHNTREMIGLHMRFGDKLGMPTVYDYASVLDVIVKSKPDLKVFAASDDPKALETLKRLHGERIVAYETRCFRRDTEEATIDSAVNLFLLRSTRGVIGSSHSSYSICAGWDCGFRDITIGQRCQNFPIEDGRFKTAEFKI